MDSHSTIPMLPPAFTRWFAARGWELRWHQTQMLAKAGARRSALLIAPTGAGKTLAGFLPSLIDLAQRKPAIAPRGVHTLYILPHGANGRCEARRISC